MAFSRYNHLITIQRGLIDLRMSSENGRALTVQPFYNSSIYSDLIDVRRVKNSVPSNSGSIYYLM